MSEAQPLLYTDLAGWFHLLTRPDEYVEEAAAYRDAFLEATGSRPRTLLELGAGGYLLREDGLPLRALHDRHVEGVFPRATWLGLLKAAGFQIHSASRPGDDGEPDEVFVCVRA